MSETPEHEELELDAETVRDLEPSDTEAEDVRGGLGDGGEGFLSAVGGTCKCK
jgi:hypothetical protein